MDGRKRTVQIKFRVTEAERDLILEKMKHADRIVRIEDGKIVE